MRPRQRPLRRRRATALNTPEHREGAWEFCSEAVGEETPAKRVGGNFC